LLSKKKRFPVVVKPPKGLLEEPYISCPVCGKIFKKENSLHDHLKERKKDDLEHYLFDNDKLSFNDKFNKNNNINSESDHFQYKPKFGRINIKNSEEE
jgi:hypothetical protein